MTAGESAKLFLRRSLAVGDANSDAEFVFPTSKEVGHPSVPAQAGTRVCDTNVPIVWFGSAIVRATALLTRRRGAGRRVHGKGRLALV